MRWVARAWGLPKGVNCFWGFKTSKTDLRCSAELFFSLTLFFLISRAANRLGLRRFLSSGYNLLETEKEREEGGLISRAAVDYGTKAKD